MAGYPPAPLPDDEKVYGYAERMLDRGMPPNDIYNQMLQKGLPPWKAKQVLDDIFLSRQEPPNKFVKRLLGEGKTPEDVKGMLSTQYNMPPEQAALVFKDAIGVGKRKKRRRKTKSSGSDDFWYDGRGVKLVIGIILVILGIGAGVGSLAASRGRYVFIAGGPIVFGFIMMITSLFGSKRDNADNDY